MANTNVSLTGTVTTVSADGLGVVEADVLADYLDDNSGGVAVEIYDSATRQLVDLHLSGESAQNLANAILRVLS